MIGTAPGEPPLRRVLMTGASGLIGRALARELAARGWTVVALGRGAGPGPRWDPARGRLERADLEGHEAVIHLAGASIAGRFTNRRRREIRESRVLGTRLLCEALAGAQSPPRALISASAIGYYGDRGEEPLEESSARGAGFLAEVAEDWERASAPAAEAGVRVVRMRQGLVLAREGGALPPMLRLTRSGLGGPLGSGRQWWSWIALDDLVSAFAWALEREELSGPINAVAPEPVRQVEFARSLARALRRPAWLPAPAFALRLALGSGMANSLLLSSARVHPARLIGSGFAWRHASLEGALAAILGPASVLTPASGHR